MLGVYIHIPFCKTICSYCDFCKMHYNEKFVSSYLLHLEKEIHTRYKGEPVNSIYIGGGTPSSLTVSELDHLLSILTIFNLTDNYEYTIECNIENIDIDKLNIFKSYGINRLSIGVESFDKDNITILSRHHDEDMVFDNIHLAKKYFNNINIDLIYGVSPNIDKVKNDISKFLMLDIPHISCYSLILEEHTKLWIDKQKYISEELDKEMFDYINDTLTKNGYIHYEISNYAKEGYESIHNKNYWLNGKYYGFGLSAVSFLDRHRISNTKNLTKYLDDNYIEEDNYESNLVSKENDLILGLRLIEGIDIDKYNNTWHTSILENHTIKELINDKYLKVSNNYLSCNYQYIYLLNSILTKILDSNL